MPEFKPVIVDDIVSAITNASSQREITVAGNPLQIDLPEGSYCSNFFSISTGTLSQANIKAMYATPIVLIAAPGAGKAIIVDEIELFHDYATAAYTAGDDVTINYTGSTAIFAIDKDIVLATSDAKVVMKPTIYDLDNSTATALGYDILTEANKGVTITNATQAFADGNAANLIKYSIKYHVRTLLT